jgi:hypothetical protein
MSDKNQKITATTTTGAHVEISLEDWAKLLIENALNQHKKDCPLYTLNDTQRTNLSSLDKRVDALEVKLRIVQYLTAPLYLGAVAWLIKIFTGLFEMQIVHP